MTEDIARIILSILSEYDYRLVTHHEMTKLSKESHVLGLTDFDRHKIYVRKDLQRSEKDVTMLHEFAHVFYENVGEKAGEKKVDKTAYAWLKRLYVG